MSSFANAQRNHKQSLATKVQFWLGAILLASSILFAGYLYLPFIIAESSYFVRTKITLPNQISHKKDYNELLPPNKDFAITIPAINVSAPIIQDVDPFNPYDYQRKLSEGIAHAKTSSLPGKGGNTFLFSHSSQNFILATKFNSIFYLLHHLKNSDLVNIWYHNDLFQYQVTASEIVNPDQVQYLNQVRGSGETITLMTCWPPGTNSKRLIVTAKLKPI